jgi:imidazolonepropionase
MRGAPYLAILEAGGGIHSTVEATRAASEDELVRLAVERLGRALRFGVTTMEVKSGYGLDEASEIKMLLVARKLGEIQPVRIVPTFLGAHVVPLEYKDRRDAYVDLLVNRLIPEISRLGLAAACDVYLDDGAFTRDEAMEILSAGKRAGLAPKIHAGQFSDKGGPQLVASLGGLSADHLEVVSAEGVEAMAASGMVANLLPGAAFSLRDGFPDGRRFADAGVRVALATDDNPGSSRTENLPLMAAMGAARMGLTCAEAMKGITINAAFALGIDGEVGSLVPGRQADLVLLAIPDFRAFLYHFGVNHVVTVIKGGRVAARGSHTRNGK